MKRTNIIHRTVSPAIEPARSSVYTTDARVSFFSKRNPPRPPFRSPGRRSETVLDVHGGTHSDRETYSLGTAGTTHGRESDADLTKTNNSGRRSRA